MPSGFASDRACTACEMPSQPLLVVNACWNQSWNDAAHDDAFHASTRFLENGHPADSDGLQHFVRDARPDHVQSHLAQQITISLVTQQHLQMLGEMGERLSPSISMNN